MDLLSQPKKKRQLSLLESHQPVHRIMSATDLDKRARKLGFKSWQKLVQKASKDISQARLPTKQIKVSKLDTFEVPTNWLSLLLSNLITMPYEKAMQIVLTDAKNVEERNFASDYSTAMKAYIIDHWRHKEIESMVDLKPLVSMSDLFALAAMVMSMCIDAERTTAQETLHGKWSLDFFQEDMTKNKFIPAIKEILVDAFSEQIDFGTILKRVHGELEQPSYISDAVIVAAYCYFNKYTSYLNKPKDIEEKMVLTVAFYLVGLLNNKSNVEHYIQMLSFPWQSEMIDNLLNEWFK